jgi:uncharacterized membrane protein YphA (DoxX/SURF4 family)
MRVGVVYLRVALGLGFLSAVADRFGWWGRFARGHVAWGDFGHFIAYTAKLNWFLPPAAVPAIAWAATVAEVVLGVMLLVGIAVRTTAFFASVMLTLFALSMTFALGIKAPLDYSVFSAAAGAWVLAEVAKPVKTRTYISDVEV